MRIEFVRDSFERFSSFELDVFVGLVEFLVAGKNFRGLRRKENWWQFSRGSVDLNYNYSQNIVGVIFPSFLIKLNLSVSSII